MRHVTEYHSRLRFRFESIFPVAALPRAGFTEGDFSGASHKLSGTFEPERIGGQLGRPAISFGKDVLSLSRAGRRAFGKRCGTDEFAQAVAAVAEGSQPRHGGKAVEGTDGG